MNSCHPRSRTPSHPSRNKYQSPPLPPLPLLDQIRPMRSFVHEVLTLLPFFCHRQPDLQLRLLNPSLNTLAVANEQLSSPISDSFPSIPQQMSISASTTTTTEKGEELSLQELGSALGSGFSGALGKYTTGLIPHWRENAWWF